MILATSQQEVNSLKRYLFVHAKILFSHEAIIAGEVATVSDDKFHLNEWGAFVELQLPL